MSTMEECQNRLVDRQQCNGRCLSSAHPLVRLSQRFQPIKNRTIHRHCCHAGLMRLKSGGSGLSSATKRALGMARASMRPCSKGVLASPRLCSTRLGTATRGDRSVTSISPITCSRRMAISGEADTLSKSLNQRISSRVASARSARWTSGGRPDCLPPTLTDQCDRRLRPRDIGGLPRLRDPLAKPPLGIRRDTRSGCRTL